MTATLPRALVIGPMKAGTSWIHEYLASRGDVCLPGKVKETYYFDRNHHRGPRWYARHFRHYDPAQHRLTIEVAPSLFHHPDAPGRVVGRLGQVPLIVTRRDPVARAWSHYQHLLRKGYTTARLEEAVESFPAILLASRYQFQLARWREAMPDAPITVLDIDDLASDRSRYAATLSRKLGLPAIEPPDDLRVTNAAGVPGSPKLARAGSVTANALRAGGAHGVVNVAKRLGLKRFFYGAASSEEDRARPSEAEYAFLKHALERT